ncbi:hypothetical protein WKW77_30670 [Variovorax ureilyticus]|uniref:Uncharacterized protein n=1 Tax=Variovorax ureilyticus TaxID=1836198 RepID=A0ABU8VP92_9BURK
MADLQLARNTTQTIKYTYPGDTPMSKATAAFLTKGLRAELITTAMAGAQAQEKMGNSLNFTVVDGTAGRSLLEVNRKAVLRFGQVLSRQALRDVERALVAAINNKTTRRSGTLSSMGNWHWVMTNRGENVNLNTMGKNIQFSADSKLMLLPENVPYATVTNRKVANSKLPGFMKVAAKVASQSRYLVGFRVSVNTTRRFAVPGEKNDYGTAYLVIRPGARSSSRRR